MAKTINMKANKQISKKELNLIIKTSVAYGIGVGQTSGSSIDAKNIHKFVSKGVKYIKTTHLLTKKDEK
jgi:hypothetical protein